jgi:competence protein ComEA
MNTTPQERLALGVVALLVSAGVGARLLHHDAPAALTGAGMEADSAAFGDLRGETARRTDEAERRQQPLARGETIDPNTASEAELDRLPRVGPGQARKIVEWRQGHAPFRTLADLDSVPGVGAALLAAVAPYVALAPAPAAARASTPAVPPAEAAASPAAARPVELNTATAAELEALPGIGPSLAARVVAWRAKNGPFRSVEDLEKVPGIGPATATRLRPLVRATP